LFTGALGRKRAFFVCPSQPKIELPSDLLGIIVAEYDSNRVGGRSDEIAAAVQVPCQQIKEIIHEEWKLIQESAEKTATRIRASEKGKAIERLHSIVIQLRDAVMVVQRDAFAAISDENSFTKVKNIAMGKVAEIADSFKDDARLIGVDREIEALSIATTEALDDLPFPHEFSMGRDATRRKVIDTGLGALNTFLQGGDPFRHVEDTASEEADMRIDSLRNRYMKWWDRHYPIIEEATAKLQDKLFQAAMNLASIAYARDIET